MTLSFYCQSLLLTPSSWVLLSIFLLRLDVAFFRWSSLVGAHLWLVWSSSPLSSNWINVRSFSKMSSYKFPTRLPQRSWPLIDREIGSLLSSRDGYESEVLTALAHWRFFMCRPCESTASHLPPFPCAISLLGNKCTLQPNYSSNGRLDFSSSPSLHSCLSIQTKTFT